MKQPTDSMCRMCYKAEEHTKHTVAGSTELAPSDYTNRHNKVAGYSHWTTHINIWGYRLLTSTMNIPERFIIVNSTTIMWDIPIITDRKILANQPDIVLHDKKRRLVY